MRKAGYLIFAVMLPLALANAYPALAEPSAESATGNTGMITAIDPVSRKLSIDKQDFLLAQGVVVHGLGEDVLSVSELQNGMNILFKLRDDTTTSAAVRNSESNTITEIWPFTQ